MFLARLCRRFQPTAEYLPSSRRSLAFTGRHHSCSVRYKCHASPKGTSEYPSPSIKTRWRFHFGAKVPRSHAAPFLPRTHIFSCGHQQLSRGERRESLAVAKVNFAAPCRVQWQIGSGDAPRRIPAQSYSWSFRKEALMASPFS
jgi:hypothetical protein